MKTKIAVSIALLLITFIGNSQNYSPLNYYYNGTPTNGIKIKTNIPFQNGIGMPTIMLEGYDYAGGNVIDIKLNWYVYNDAFYRANGTSTGTYKPNIKLCNDNGKVSIYINDKKYYTRFAVKAFAHGKGENAAMFSGWTVADEPISGTQIKDIAYKSPYSEIKSNIYEPLKYYLNSTPVNGIKIKTNIPFRTGLTMPTVMLEGYDYAGGNVIDVKLNWYVYNDKFYKANASTSGSYAPEIKLANDNGKVSIYLNDRRYYTRFNVRVFAAGKGETAEMFSNWVAVDEPISGTEIKTVGYRNNFNGKVGIGTYDTKGFELGVNGRIAAKEVKIANHENWADFVFLKDYDLPTLKEVENHIKEKGHLKNIPSAEQVKENGFFLGEMDAKLLQKIEELTLYTIDQDKKIEKLEKENNVLKSLIKRIEALEKQSKK